ncbi:hypothetical protein [Calidifontibacter terrae]
MHISRKLVGIGTAAAIALGIGGANVASADATTGVATIRQFKDVDIASELAGALGITKAQLISKAYGQHMSVAEIGAAQGLSRSQVITRLNNRAATFLLPKDRALASSIIMQNLDKHI